MKSWAVFLLLAFIISSCSQKFTHIDKVKEIYGINFSEYTERGFLFTPYSYDSDYEAIGLIEVKLRAGYEYRDKDITYKASGKVLKKGWFLKDSINVDEALRFSCVKSVQMRADAVCDLKVSVGSESFFDGILTITVPTLEIRGFAIKRK